MIDKEEDIVDIVSPTSLILIVKLGRSFSSFLGDDFYHLNGFAHYLFNIIGEKKLLEQMNKDESENKDRIKGLSKNWDNFLKKWKKFDKLITKAKGYWDKIENKDFKKITDKDLREYCKYAKYIPLIIDDLMTLTIFMISKTSIKRMSVPNYAWVTPTQFGKPNIIDQRKVGEPIIHHE